MSKNIEDNAHDARREIRTAIGSLKSAIESLEPYAELEYEEHATNGLAVNMSNLVGSIGRDGANAAEAVSNALRYVMRAAPEVEAMLIERREEIERLAREHAEEAITVRSLGGLSKGVRGAGPTGLDSIL